MQNISRSYTKELSRTNAPNPDVFGGSGIIILRSLCNKLTYSGNGNKAEAIYIWEQALTEKYENG